MVGCQEQVWSSNVAHFSGANFDANSNRHTFMWPILESRQSLLLSTNISTFRCLPMSLSLNYLVVGDNPNRIFTVNIGMTAQICSWVHAESTHIRCHLSLFPKRNSKYFSMHWIEVRFMRRVRWVVFSLFIPLLNSERSFFYFRATVGTFCTLSENAREAGVCINIISGTCKKETSKEQNWEKHIQNRWSFEKKIHTRQVNLIDHRLLLKTQLADYRLF